MAPRTGKIIKNGLNIFERLENLLQNGVLHFVFRLTRGGKLEFTQTKNEFSKKGLALKVNQSAILRQSVNLSFKNLDNSNKSVASSWRLP